MYPMPFLCQYVQNDSEGHVCPLCNKGFSRKGNMVRHLKLHQGIKPFMCEECHRKFSTRCNLESHRRTHARQPLTTCEYCGRVFRRLAFLKKHIKSHLQNGDGKRKDYIKQARRQRHDFLQARLEKAKQINEMKAFRRRETEALIKTESPLQVKIEPYCDPMFLPTSLPLKLEPKLEAIPTMNENLGWSTESYKKLPQNMQHELTLAWAYINAQIRLSAELREYSNLCATAASKTCVNDFSSQKSGKEEGEILRKFEQMQFGLNELDSENLKPMEFASSQLSSDQLASNQLNSDRLNSDQLDSNQLGSDQLCSDQLCSDQLCSSQLCSDQLCSELCSDLGSNRLDSNQLESNQLDSNQLDSNHLGSDQLGSDQLGSDQLGSDQLGSDQINPDQRASDQLASDQIVSDPLCSSELDSNELSSAELELSQLELNQLKLNQDGENDSKTQCESPQDKILQNSDKDAEHFVSMLMM